MKLQVELALASLIGSICILHGLCDELSTSPGINNWTCICSLPYQGNQSYIKSNCSTSCDCTPDMLHYAGGTWRCTCAADGFPKVVSDSHALTCFTACNCSSGYLDQHQRSRNHISSKVVVIILLLCVVFATLVFLGSAACYLFQKERCRIQSPIFSSDREPSINSATDLIGHRTPSISVTKVHIGAETSPISGCFRKGSFLLKRKSEIIHGPIMRFSFTELEYATDRFSHSNLIGLGGSSYVYRGKLKDGRTMAVKRLVVQGGPDADSLFSKEVELLSRLHHYHVVPLLGYCSAFQGKHSERLLVFDYMHNGNLRDCLDGILGESMNWEMRITIAIGAARGLEYLHEAAAPRILHRDVKSTNILLDENWRAKITDLGMAKCLRADGAPSASSSPARMQGTFGYFAPEYAMVGRASLMSDVFSLGVVILELITGRKPIHKSTNRGEESLVLWATPRLQDSRRVISELPDPRLKGNFPEEEMQIMAYLAKECLLLDPDARPTMSEVVQILSTISPDKSRRRDVAVNFFQISSNCSMKSEPNIDKHVSDVEDSVDEEELVQDASITQSAQSSSPSDGECTSFSGTDCKEADVSSTDYMDRLIFLTSQPRSWHVTDDEAVDLIKPRLESFCLESLDTK